MTFVLLMLMLLAIPPPQQAEFPAGPLSPETGQLEPIADRCGEAGVWQRFR